MRLVKFQTDLGPAGALLVHVPDFMRSLANGQVFLHIPAVPSKLFQLHTQGIVLSHGVHGGSSHLHHSLSPHQEVGSCDTIITPFSCVARDCWYSSCQCHTCTSVAQMTVVRVSCFMLFGKQTKDKTVQTGGACRSGRSIFMQCHLVDDLKTASSTCSGRGVSVQCKIRTMLMTWG